MAREIAPIVYALTGTRGGKPYVGATTDRDRLRRHNGELTGGAKRTARNRPWRYFLKVHGFLSFEAALWFEDKLKLKPRTIPRVLRPKIKEMQRRASLLIRDPLPRTCHRWVAAALAIAELPGWGRVKSTPEERALIDRHCGLLRVQVVPASPSNEED